MRLGDVLRTITDQCEEAIILAREPWSPMSDAIVREFPDDLPVAEMTDDGKTYFLEVSVACEVIEGLKSAGWREGEALYERVIQYAINDA